MTHAAGAWRGLGWSLIGPVLRLAVQFVSLVVLARLIPPAAFGVVAVGLIGIQLARLTDPALGGLLVRRGGLDDADTDFAFTLHLGLGLGVLLVVLLLADPLAAALGDPDAAGVLRVLALSLPFLAVAQVLTALCEVHARFRQLQLMSLVASLVAVCGLAVPLALAGQALAALVALTLGAAVLQVLLLWCVVPRRPGLRLRHGDWRAFAAHGLQAAGIQTAALVVASGDQWMVSRLGSADQLGQYNRATSLVQSPLQAAAGGLSSWLYPRFCRLPVGPQRSAAACSLLIALLAVVLVPVEVCALRAPGIAHLVLGSGWELVGTVLPACAVAAPAAVLGLWGSLLLWAEGRLGIENLVTWLVAMGLLLGWWLVAGQGMVAIAWVTCAGAWVRALGLAVPAISGRTVGGMRGAGRAMSLLVLVLVAEAAWLQVRNSPLTPSGQLVECITVTLVTWGACAVVLWRSGLLARIRADFQGVSLVADAPQG